MPRMTDSSTSWTPTSLTQAQYSYSRADDGSGMVFSPKKSSPLSDIIRAIMCRGHRSHGEQMEAAWVRSQRESRRQERARLRRENQELLRGWARAPSGPFEQQAPIQGRFRFTPVNRPLRGHGRMNPINTGSDERLTAIQEETETSTVATPSEGGSAIDAVRQHWSGSARPSLERQRQDPTAPGSASSNEAQSPYIIDPKPAGGQAVSPTGATSTFGSRSRDVRRPRNRRMRSSISHAASSLRRDAERRPEERRGDHLRRLGAQSYYAVAQAYFDALSHLNRVRYWLPPRHSKTVPGPEPMMIPMNSLSSATSTTPQTPAAEDEQGFGGIRPLNRQRIM
jgi:hypothetical protein